MSEVRAGSTVKAAYVWLADGTKLGVESGDGADGFEYVGSLIYRKSGNSLLLCEALFGDGVIRINDNSTQEVNYFLTDHLGSVRVIVDAAETVKERNDYYPFGARHVRSDYAQSTNRWKYNGKELQTTGDLGYLDYGARMYDAGLGRWFCADPEAESRYVLTPYHYCSNNPLLFVDKDGKWDTHYIDQYNNVILQTNDGSDDVVRVPANRMSEFLSVLEASRWDLDRLNSRGWNDYWKSEFGLADIQFNEAALRVLDMFHSNWSRNAAAAYLLKPTLGNAFKMGFSEGLSQWTDPELVVAGLSAGLLGWQDIAKIARVEHSKVFKPLGRGSTGRITAKNLQEQLAMEEIMSDPSSGIILIENIKDTRWSGWDKMSNETAHGVEIHYNALWKNKRIIAVDDFKFINNPRRRN